MSKETDAMTEAVDMVICEQIRTLTPGALVTGWALVISSIEPGDSAGTTTYTYPVAKHQPLHHSIGMLMIAADAAREMGTDDDD